MKIAKRAYAAYTADAVALLGKLVRHGRTERAMTQKELAERLGIARSTLQRLENGDPKVEIGIMFEAATIVGVKLFETDSAGITQLSERMDDRIAVLPQRVRAPKITLIDDF